MLTKTVTGANVLFEDEGTNSAVSRLDKNEDPPDTDDAANFGAALRAVGLTDTVTSGIVINFNGNDDTASITSGVAVLDADTAEAHLAAQTRYEVCYVARVPSVSGIQLYSNAVNELYLHLPLTDNDSLQVVVRDPDNDPQPNRPRLHIGTIDTTVTTPSAQPHNRGVDLNVASMFGGITDGATLRSLVGGDFTIDGSGNLIIDASGSDNLSNAETLGGQPPSYYAALGENETVTGSWTFNSGLTVGGNITDSSSRTVYNTSTGRVPAARIGSGVDAGSYKGNDIDSDGDGIVNAAQTADALGGVSAGNYARTDQETQFNADVTYGQSSSIVFDRGRTETTDFYWNASSSTDNGVYLDIDGPDGFTFLENGRIASRGGQLSLNSATGPVNIADDLTIQGSTAATMPDLRAVAGSVLANGQVTLSGGSATVNTGVPVSTSGFYDVKVRPEDGADIAASLEDDTGGTGNWVIHLKEHTTSVGTPDCGWQLTGG